MNWKPFFFLGAIVLIVASTVFIFWSGNDTQTIKIGYVSPLTGDAATYGEPMRKATALAVEEINEAGGVNGRMLEVIYEDSRCKGKDALSAVQKLISIDHVQVVSGFACAEDVLTSASVIEENNILTLAPGASGPNVSLAGDFIFQTNPSTTVALKMLAELIYKNYKSVALLSEESAFAQDNKSYLTKEFEALGGQVVFSESFSSETKDFKTIIAKMKEENFPAIFVNSQTEITGGLIVKQIREAGVEAQLFGVDILSGPKVREIAGSAIEGALFVTVPDLDSSNEKAQAFLKKYEARFGEAPFALYLAAAYDSMYLIAQALENTGNDTVKMKEYLYHMPLYDGAVGKYRFDTNGDIVGINFTVKKIESGELVPVPN